MKTPALLLLAASTLLAGFGLGVLFAHAGPAAPPLTSGESGPSAAPHDPAPPIEGVARRAAGVVAPAAATPQDVAPVSEAALERARAGITATDAAIGIGEPAATIHGVVASPLGEPIAGAVVVATLALGADPHGEDPRDAFRFDPDGPDLDEVLATRANDWARSRSFRVRATSGSDGSYTLGPLPDGVYQVTGHHADWVFAAGDQVPRVAAGSRHDVIGRRLTRCEIDVRLPDGTQPAVAALEVRQNVGTRGRTRKLRWTPGTRAVAVEDAPGTVAAAADFVVAPEYLGRGPARLASDPLRLTPGQPMALQLRPRRGIYGRVVAPEHGPIDVQVALLDLARTPAITAAAFQAELRSGGHLREGVFSFVDLEPGNYAVGALTWSGTLLTHATTTVGEGLIELVLEVPRPVRDASLRVLCLGPDGAPLHEVAFAATTARGDEEREAELAAVMRDPDGFWWLPHSQFWPPTGDLPADAVIRLRASHPTLGSAAAEASPATRELTLEFDRPCTLLVEVPGYAGRGAGTSYRIQIAPKGESDEPPDHYFGDGSRHATLLADGTAWIDGLSRGSYWLHLSRTDRWNQMLGGRVVEVQGTPTRVTVPMPPTHTLVFEAPDLESGTRVWIQSSADDPMTNHHDGGMLDGDRRCLFQDVPAGRYTLMGNGVRPRSDIVVPGGPYTLERERIDCLRVSISDTDGALHRAGLRMGDLVTAINGVAVTHDTWWKVLNDEGGKRNVPVTVLRDGATVDIPGGDHAWNGPEGQLGGVLTAASRSGR